MLGPEVSAPLQDRKEDHGVPQPICPRGLLAGGSLAAALAVYTTAFR